MVATIANGAGPEFSILGAVGCAALPLDFAVLEPGGVVDSLSSSGMVGQ